MEKETQFTTHHSRLTKAAFTLAETLIVIGIIGVVAALTLPSLNHATGDKETITRVKKAYSTLTEAVDRMEATYGPTNEWWDKDCDSYVDVINKFGERITEFMKVTKNCKQGGGCWINPSNNSYSFIIGDGSSVRIYNRGLAPWIDIYVDVDGPNKGKTQGGRDVFLFAIYMSDSEYKGVVPISNTSSLTEEMGSNIFSNENYRQNVITEISADWILKYENMDYLKTDSSMKCNDNPSIILDGVTNTSCH